MSDPNQYEDPPAPARSAGPAADDAASPAVRADVHRLDQRSARRARPDEAESGRTEAVATRVADPDDQPSTEHQLGKSGPPSGSTAVARRPESNRGAESNRGPGSPESSLRQAAGAHGDDVSRGIHARVEDHREPESKVFSNLNLNGPVPARVRPTIGEWGPQQVPSTKSKKRGRILVNVWLVGAALAIFALGYFFFMALTGRPLFG